MEKINPSYFQKKIRGVLNKFNSCYYRKSMNKSNRITQSVVLGLITLVAALNWAGLKNVFFEEGQWIWPSLGFLILLILLSLGWLLIKSKSVLFTSLIVILACFFFSFGFKLEYLAVLFIAFLLFLFGSLRTINEKEVRIKLQISKILRRGLPYVLTGLSLIIATVYYFSPLIVKNQNQIQIPRPLFDIIIQPVNELISEQRDILYQTINQQINKYSQPYQQYFPLGLAMGMFFALKLISIPFIWLVILSSWLIFKLLISLGAIKIQEQAVLKEIIEL